MASILSHQVESRVNDLYTKMQRHAQIIMRLSIEVDNLKTDNDDLRNENEDLRKTILDNRRAVKQLCKAHNSVIVSDETILNVNYEKYNEEPLSDIEVSKELTESIIK